MIKTKILEDNTIKVYSDENKPIMHFPTRGVHSEYVVKSYIPSDYAEITEK